MKALNWWFNFLFPGILNSYTYTSYFHFFFSSFLFAVEKIDAKAQRPASSTPIQLRERTAPAPDKKKCCWLRGWGRTILNLQDCWIFLKINKQVLKFHCFFYTIHVGGIFLCKFCLNVLNEIISKALMFNCISLVKNLVTCNVQTKLFN